MPQLHGKQIKSGSVAISKLAETVIKADGTQAFTGDQSLGNNKLTNVANPTNAGDAANKSYVDSIAAGIRDFKDSVRVATAAALPANTRNGNVLTADANGVLPNIDGVALAANDRLLVKNEAAAENNGIYVVTELGGAGDPWILTRAADADTSAEVTAGMFCFVNEGSANGDTGFVLSTNDPIVLNTTALSFVKFVVSQQATPQVANKEMTASVTANDGDEATATAIAATPANGSYVAVFVNGVKQVVGNGVKTKDCYFSADAGATAKTFSAIATGDKLYWNGSIAGFQLDATDKIDFDYSA